jgi:hypothetical protein
MMHIIKNVTLETSIVILSYGIIFVFENLYYIDQIGYLDTHVGLVNWNGESTILKS